MPGIYLLKDLSIKTGLSIHTIKYYLRLGLIREVDRSPDTNFRYFNDKTVESLLRVRELRKSGQSLKRIKKIIT